MAVSFSVNFITRLGFVAIIRNVKTFFDPVPNYTRGEVLCTLFVNGGAVNDNVDIPVGASQDDLINCFVVVDENQEFRVTVRTTVGGDPLSTFYSQVYGNYLLKTEMPANMQVASCINPTGAGIRPSDLPGAHQAARVLPPLISQPAGFNQPIPPAGGPMVVAPRRRMPGGILTSGNLRR